MRGGLRWPDWPFQVICVLVAVLLTAAFSSCLGLGRHRALPPVLSVAKNLGDHSDLDVIAIARKNPNNIAYDFPAIFHESDVSPIRTMSGRSGRQTGRPAASSVL